MPANNAIAATTRTASTIPYQPPAPAGPTTSTQTAKELAMAELPRLNGIIKALEEGSVAFVGSAPADERRGQLGVEHLDQGLLERPRRHRQPRRSGGVRPRRPG